MFEKIADYINTIPCRSAWRRGVRVYALELLEELEEHFDGGYITEDVFTDGKKLEKDIPEVYDSPGGKERYWEQVPLVFRKQNYAVEVRECFDEDIVEIDTFRELKAIDRSYDV